MVRNATILAAITMACRSERLKPPSITARPSPEEMARFARLAAASGLSESALALKAIRGVLSTDAGAAITAAADPAHEPATDRITIRLRPGDGEAIAHRAHQRGMRASTYLAALVRGHISANPPLAACELSALKQSVVVLAGIGRLLAQACRAPAAVILREDLQRTRAAVAVVEQLAHDLAKAALISWESRGV